MSGQLRAVIYARFSTELQRDASIEDQIRSCRDYAARQGLKVVTTYSDRAESGASLMRSGIQKLLRDALRRLLVVQQAHVPERACGHLQQLGGLGRDFRGNAGVQVRGEQDQSERDGHQ